jgi:hypothetical protein
MSAKGLSRARGRGCSMPSARDGLIPPDEPGPVPVPRSLRELSALFLRVRDRFNEKGKAAGQRPVTNRQIGQMAFQSSKRHFIPGRPGVPLAKAPADGHLSGVL